MYLAANMVDALGLADMERAQLRDLIDVFNSHAKKNAEKNRYYEGHITLGEVNLGLALPDGIKRLEIGCEWGAKTVDVLASRSMFDGFVGTDGNDAEGMRRIMDGNRLRAEYMKACRDELKYGCTFATLSADKVLGARIRFHSPETAVALWDGDKGRIDCGLAVIDVIKKNGQTPMDVTPSVIRFDTDKAIITFRRVDDTRWSMERQTHRMGRPLMVPMIWNATSQKPFGRSRLKEPIRRLIQGYVRTVANATIGLEFATSPQKYLLGVTDDQYDQVISQKFRQYIGSILAATTNPETGANPVFGQLQQGTIEPHVQMIRVLATQFAAATGLSVVDTGVINDANPTSSDAILAQSQTLVLMAEQLNAGNGDALRMIALMAQAIARNCTLEDLTEDELNIIAHFKNPAMPSVSVTADAAIKISSVRPDFAGTDTFLEMIGFDQADIRRIRGQEARVRGTAVLNEEFTEDENIDEGVG